MASAFWLIPLVPALGSLILFVFGRRLSRKAVSVLAPGAVAVSFLLSVAAFIELQGLAAEERLIIRPLFTWIAAGRFHAALSFQFDPLSAVMVLVVTCVGFLIHLYSIGYMAGDKGYHRFFAYLNLFMFAMLVLVLASNLVLMFVGWEGVGLCSYLLIGFWFERPSAASAGKKAFLVNRIGDAGFLLGILFIVLAVGSTEFEAVRNAVGAGALAPGLITLIAILLFVGATGKSAQVPLYVWLPDAMEGPTPVSALIHAATMVTAGVYLVARLNWLYAASPAASSLVAITGAVTAVFAATMALTQNDIKRVLAYSTISQLGYMFIGCGVGAAAAGIFHLYTHAFFKSLLFLAAGSVIHALSGEQDMRRMGGLRKHLPKTFPVFLVAAIAIAGVPFFSGFFSKDAILTQAFAHGHIVIWALGLIAAIMTAFYMFRLIFLTFYGGERFGGEAGHHLHESPGIMTGPLIVLAAFSVVAGYVGLPAVVGARADVFRRFLEPVIPAAEGHLALGTEWLLILASVTAAAIGIAVAFRLYLQKPDIPPALAARFPGAYKLLVNKYYVDELYGAVVVRPLVQGSDWIYRRFDLKVVDGAVNGSAAATNAFAKILAFLQSGFIKDYGLAFLLGLVVILGALLF
jgi:NADH-quinone oxidoreductase subunit L